MSISTKLSWLFCGLFVAVALTIKVYFIPEVDRYLELSVKHEMERDMAAFEHIILVVVTAAGTHQDFVRRALVSISENPDIPMVLRRGPTIDAQFGEVPARGPANALEWLVVARGEPIFHRMEDHFEYIYPLKARPVCGNCHVASDGTPVAGGEVLGLAVKQVPTATLKESSLMFFVLDVFWHNLMMVGVVLAVVLICLWRWVGIPLRGLLAQSEEAVFLLAENGELDPLELPVNEWQRLDRVMAMLGDRNEGSTAHARE